MSRATSWLGLTLTWLALMALAALSFLLAELHLGPLGTPLAIGIAAIKAALVGAVFMELIEEKFSARMAIATGVLFLAILAGLMAVDVATRATPPALPANTTG